MADQQVSAEFVRTDSSGSFVSISPSRSVGSSHFGLKDASEEQRLLARAHEAVLQAQGSSATQSEAVRWAAQVTAGGAGAVPRSADGGHGSTSDAVVEAQHAPSVDLEREGNSDWEVLLERLRNSPIKTAMLVTVPLSSLAASTTGTPEWLTFWLSFFALVPLSAFLAQATEDLAGFTSEIVAGLINATLGNIVEMMVVISALLHGHYALVQATLLGSILSNLLFVLGCCLLWGGSKKHEMKFNSKAATTCCSLLLLGVVSVFLPTTLAMYFAHSTIPAEDFVLPMSRYSSLVILCAYGQFLVFQLQTHKDYFNSDSDEEADDEPKWSVGFSVVMLILTSLLTAYTSDALVSSVQGYSEKMGVGEAFIGLILVASVGNVPEFYVTMMVAANDKMDLALSIAIGSSCQMVLFVTPVAVLTGWAMNRPMSLDFHELQLTSLVLAVLIVSAVIQDGHATWIQGSLLATAYFIIATVFFMLPPGWPS